MTPRPRVGERRPVRVSANVAGITRTGSMDIPLFQAGFVGAEALGVRSYAPETMRAISGLVYLENLLDPSSIAALPDPSVDENERARRLHATQIHGGSFAYPYATDGALLRAGLIGLAQAPGARPRASLAACCAGSEALPRGCQSWHGSEISMRFPSGSRM